MAKILDGLGIANQIKQEISVEVAEMVSNGEKRPNLATILVGKNPAS